MLTVGKIVTPCCITLDGSPNLPHFLHMGSGCDQEHKLTLERIIFLLVLSLCETPSYGQQRNSWGKVWQLSSVWVFGFQFKTHSYVKYIFRFNVTLEIISAVGNYYQWQCIQCCYLKIHRTCRIKLWESLNLNFQWEYV